MTTREHLEGTPHMGPSNLEVMDYAARIGVSIKDIPSYIPPSCSGVQDRKPTNNQRY